MAVSCYFRNTVDTCSVAGLAKCRQFGYFLKAVGDQKMVRRRLWAHLRMISEGPLLLIGRFCLFFHILMASFHRQNLTILHNLERS